MIEETKKKRKIRAKGAIPSSLSSGKIGVEPKVITVTNTNWSSRNIIKCGRGGRYHAEDADWKYFVSSNKVLQLPGLSKEGSERNREVVVNIGEINSMKNLSQVKRQLKNQVRVAILEG